MAAPVGHSSSCWRAPEVYKHHEQRRVCISRPKYREGRKAKAVKVYTINLESRYVMIQGVPAIGVMSELIQLCALYGVVEEYRPLDEYPAEEFTEVYLVRFQKLTSARAAKRYMDEKSFYGGVLHVCYVPEYETVEDTRLKLQDRRRYVARAVHHKAREEEKRKVLNKEPVLDTATTPGTTVPRHEETSASEKPETSTAGHFYGYPLLPLPPREHPRSAHRGTPTEDRMGTLHTAVTEAPPQPSSSTAPPCSEREGQGSGSGPGRAAVARFVPRTAQLENRKRKMEEEEEHLTDPKHEPLIGPKLPEPPKLDMEDESLNTTMNLIRNTMKKVESVSVPKPVEKKVKPRRRI